MKITEITEGFNERQSTDEGWGEFKSAAKDAAGSAFGAVARSGMRGLRRAGAKMGSGRMQGQLKMDKAIMGVMKNYQRYLGQANLDQTYGSLESYLKALGIENPQMNVMEVAKGAWAGKARGGFDPSKRGAQQPKAQQPAQQAPATAGKEASKKLTRNQVAEIIRNNLEAAMKAGTLPKEIQKFLST